MSDLILNFHILSGVISRSSNFYWLIWLHYHIRVKFL